MALTYDFTECTDFEQLRDPYEQAITGGIAMLSMPAMLGSVTTDNIDEWQHRIAAVEAIYGAFLQNADGPVQITREHLLRRVGLRMNVATQSRAAFERNMARIRSERAADARR